MEDKNEILKRYYRGESTLEEERLLKEAYRQKELPDDPMLAFNQSETVIPPELPDMIRQNIHANQQRRTGVLRVILGSIAASLILIVSLRSLIQDNNPHQVQLSDNLKKERFEDALRVIGNVLEEEKPDVQKVLYEDHNLIIAIE